MKHPAVYDLEKSSTATVYPLHTEPPPMSLNQRGKIGGQVVRPGVATSDRKQKRPSTGHPHPPAPAASEDIIDISSDEDEDLQPPPKRTLTKRRHQASTHESDYKACLSQKDHEIEKLKEVRHQRLSCSHFGLISYCAEGERAWTSHCKTAEGNRGKEVSGYSRASNP